jgi:hypothetical protein
VTTTTSETQTPATATVVTPATDAVVPALLKDDGGYFRMVRGRRIPVNEPGIAILDGTPAESSYASAEALDRSIKALQAQYDEHINIVKAVVGDKSVAMLKGQRVVTYRWGQRTDVDRALTQAIVSDEQWDMIAVPSPQRPFEPRFRKSSR